MDSRTILSFLGALTFYLAASGCASQNKFAQGPALSVEFSVVLFKESRPAIGETLEESVTDVEWTRKALSHDALLISRVSHYKFRALGTTDTAECDPSECHELGMRRARLVQDWLIAHGVDQSRLLAPTSLGSSRPLTDNGDEAERSANRLGYVELVPQ